MAFAKKTWKDRIAEFPTRRRLTKEDNTSELVTVAREEGTLSQEGDAFSADNMNDLESRIDAEFTEVNGKLTKITHYSGITANNQYVVNSNNSAIIDDYIFINVTINGTIPTSWTDIATLDDAVNYTAVVGMLQGINGVARIEIKSNKIIAQGLSSGGGVSFCAMCKKSNIK